MLTSHPLHPGAEPYPGCRLRRPLNRNAHAEVWEGVTADDRPVALKFLPGDDDQAFQYDVPFLLVVRRLSHLNLISIDRVWCHLNYIVVAMELAHGSLLDLLKVHGTEFGTPLGRREVCHYLAQAADALDFLNTRKHRFHGQHVALQHGNVKPSNLLRVGDKIKLTDFKLTSKPGSPSSHERMTETLHYSAPEAFHGGIVSDRTDQYALAVTYYHLRTGRLPFSDTPETLDADYVRPEPDLTMLSEEERPLIARALAPAPENRWPSCVELIARLSNVAT